MHRCTQSPLFGMLFILIAALSASANSWGGIAVIVNPSNPIESLSDLEVKKIFLGRITRFPSTNQNIRVLDQNRESDIYKQFYEQTIGFKLSKLTRFRAAFLFSGDGVLPVELSDSAAIKEQILSQTSAIGYISEEHIDESVKVIYVWR